MVEDEHFSFDRLKSFFLRSLCAWATMIIDVDLSFVRRPFRVFFRLLGGLVSVCFGHLFV